MIYVCSTTTYATEITNAGFAFAGEFKTAAVRFPYTYKIFTQLNERAKTDSKDNQTFSYLITQRTKSLTNPEIEFLPPGALVKLKGSDQALMSVLMLTGETVSTENHIDYYKTFVNLRGDVLIFDYKSQTVVRSYPVSVVIFDATNEKPSEERITKFVEDLIRRDDEKGLVSQYIARLSKATLPKVGSKTVQVRKIEIAPEAFALMHETLRNNHSVAEAMIGDTFASILSAKLGVPMLPNSIGHAEGVMTMRLENGDDYKLKIGAGDYLFDIKLNKFAKIKTAENNISTAYVYGAYMNVHFLEPMSNIDYINSDIKNGEAAIVPASQQGSDDFTAYQDTIQGLFLKLSDAIEKPGSKWIVTAAAAKNIESQLESARQIIGTCK